MARPRTWQLSGRCAQKCSFDDCRAPFHGLIASDRLDLQGMRRTLAATQQTWDLNQTWGWDFPMLAMRAAGCSRNMAAGWGRDEQEEVTHQ